LTHRKLLPTKKYVILEIWGQIIKEVNEQTPAYRKACHLEIWGQIIKEVNEKHVILEIWGQIIKEVNEKHVILEIWGQIIKEVNDLIQKEYYSFVLFFVPYSLGIREKKLSSLTLIRTEVPVFEKDVCTSAAFFSVQFITGFDLRLSSSRKLLVWPRIQPL
jgi:hypothetical protein